MKHWYRGGLVAALLCMIPACSSAPKPTGPTGSSGGTASGLRVPVEYHKLDNGLRLVMSPDDTAPIVTVMVYYNIGFRIEPKDRTGFAHLFEHMMFQGSKNLGKMEFIKLVQSNGGVVNGSTRFDFTNYMEIAPAHTLETLLWAEADRMRGLAITQDNLTNQQGVVKNEVKVNVLNRPYGGFPWIDMPMRANENWYNAHNFYGDLKDLDAATLDDVSAFFKTYYAPNNAVVVVAGDFDSAQALGWFKQYFSDIPSAPQPDKPDISEPRQEAEKRFSKVDKLAKQPALAVGYHMPEQGTPEHYAMVLIEQMMSNGDDSLLYHELVRERAFTGRLSSSINSLGNAYNYYGPMLYTMWLIHDKDKNPDDIVAAMDSVIASLQDSEVSSEALERAKIKARSRLYDTVEGFFGVGKADLLACFALFYDDPERINTLESELMKVTPALIQKTAKEYLRTGNRTIITLEVANDANK